MFTLNIDCNLYPCYKTRPSRRMSNMFPTIEERDEHDGENPAEGHISSPNELSPNFPYMKDQRSSSTNSTRKISSGNILFQILQKLMRIV